MQNQATVWCRCLGDYTLHLRLSTHTQDNAGERRHGALMGQIPFQAQVQIGGAGTVPSMVRLLSLSIVDAQERFSCSAC